MNKFIRVKKALICIRYFYLTLKLNKVKKEIKESDECVVLGNGPSLQISLEKDLDFIKTKKIFCVNSFAATDYYSILKPNFYILADPLFWEMDYIEVFEDIKNNNLSKFNEKSNNKINLSYYKKLMDVRDNLFNSLINKTQWKLNLFVPLHSKSSGVFDELVKKNENINLFYYSTIPVNFNNSSIRHLFYKFNVGMPTPQTVLIAAIFLALKSNFKKIFLLGADHSWHEDIVLDEKNVLCSRDKHFYKENKQNLVPLVFDVQTGRTTKIHEQFHALHVAFRSHVLLEEYSKMLKIKIYNASRYTWVDAYARYKF